MINRIIAYSIEHRWLVIAAGLALAVWGAFAAYTAPIDAIPDLSENQVIVFADWPGRSPQEVEEQVTYPLSLHLQGTAGVRVVRSSSEFGFAMVHVIFNESVGLEAARTRVAQRLARAGDWLPQGVAPYLGPDALATGQIFWYALEGPSIDPGRLRTIQDAFVKPQLSAVEGVAEVASVGGYPVEYQVNVDPIRLRLRGATLGEVTNALAQSGSSVGGHVVEKGNAEYVVRGLGAIGQDPGLGAFDQARAVHDLENVVVPTKSGFVRVGDVASVAVGSRLRRGVLEMDGVEVTGGVVLMRHGENPLEVTRRIKQKLVEIAPGLPRGVRVVPFYDRTPLITGAIGTVTGTLVEAMLTSVVCVLLILMHVRTSLVIAATLPLAALAAFALMSIARGLGFTDAQTNIMSLAGIAISIGVLVDASIVVAENVMHRLKLRFGDRPVRGDVREAVRQACQTVGRPIFFSVLIMLLSFLPVFALGGLEGKMFRPLALTKSFALLAAAILAITLVPALCTLLVRGRLRGEMESWLVRSVVEVYRPVLTFFLEHPAGIVWVFGLTLVVGLAPVGSRALLLGAVGFGIIASGLAARRWPARVFAIVSLIVAALVAEQTMAPLDVEFVAPLDEGMVMDMPISVPRMSITQAADDLKARDMVLCRFPEVDMVVGKAGRAETPTDPAPLDMIETMVNFRPHELWPRRKLSAKDAERQTRAVWQALVQAGVVREVQDIGARNDLLRRAKDEALALYDPVMREAAYQRFQEFTRSLGERAREPVAGEILRAWRTHVRAVDDELRARAPLAFTRLVAEELVRQAGAVDPNVAAAVAKAYRLRTEAEVAGASASSTTAPRPAAHHHGMHKAAPLPLEPVPALDNLINEQAAQFARWAMLWQAEPEELSGFEGELDRAMAMPGWTNVWTMPIQNRVDMLATGVNTAVGVRVLGRRLEDVVRASEDVAAAVRRVPGAADVVADPVRGKGYLEIKIDRDRAARAGVSAGELNATVETAIGGMTAATLSDGRQRYPVSVRYARDWRQDEDAIRSLLVPAHGGQEYVPLTEVADVRIAEGPANIKSENGMLRNYVRMNVAGRRKTDFVADAQRVVTRDVRLPENVYLEWTGQFEHELHARRTLLWVVPAVVALIFVILYLTNHDLADAALVMLAVPGAIAGGVGLQWLFGYKFSVTVWVGYIACLGMATSTGIIMLVYLREAIEQAGGLARISAEGLRQAIIAGAAHRLRPKLLTEGTTIIGLVPLLWAAGPGAEVIRPMAVPVLGGLLMADELIDLLLPVLFYRVRLWRWQRLQWAGEGRNGAVAVAPAVAAGLAE